MHDNAIHDLALTCRSVLLSPIKRAESLSNRNSQGKAVCDWLFFNRNINRHFVLVGGKQPIDPVFSALSSSTENQNDQNHRVAASDVDFRIRSTRNSGAFFCYPLLFGLRWRERIYVLDRNNVKPLPVQVDTLPRLCRCKR